MTLLAGAKLGRYEIRSKIGEGGMGEVYLAEDSKLNRKVAIKVLPAAFSQDEERLRRFEQEAQAASALNHPNILVLYDVGTHEGAPYVVSELLEGETLRERTTGGSVAQRRVIDYALQIAHGLAAAHEKGIVHRDLKPENLFVTKDGRIKILDFGLAKLTGAANTDLSQTSIPTRRVDTDPGKVMGTAGYMSPEQVRGRPADHRSDIFSLGAILYEMLTGKRAFHGDSAVETMNAILKEDPPQLSQTNQNVAPALERVVDHCLEKHPEQRFQSARDLAFALEALSGSNSVSAQTATLSAPVGRRMTRRELILGSVAALAVLVAVVMAALYFRSTPIDEHAVRFPINPPEKTGFSSFAISPDGLRLAFVATDATGKSLLWIRPLDSITAQPLPGTEEATSPFWSPDNRLIGFFAAGKLKKIEVTSGTVQTLCNAAVPRGGTWSREGVIVFAPTPNDPLYQVSVAGGEPLPLTRLEPSRQESSHRWPYFLPDGRHLLYSVSGGPQSQGIYVTSLDAKENRRLLNITNSVVAYAPPGYLLFRRDSTLMAQVFDANQLQLSGEPFPVAEQVGYEVASFQTFFSVSQTGVLAFSTGSTGKTQLTLIDRAGKEVGLVSQPTNYIRPAFSPDGKRVTVDGVDAQGNRDIWIIDLESGNRTRFTFDPGTDIFAIWSPDGNRIAFASDREGARNLYQKSASGAGKEELLLKADLNSLPLDWSVDGRFIVYVVNAPQTKLDTWIFPVFEDQKPFPFLQSEANERNARFSPDGRWIAYTSDESGLSQVYVQSFPDSGGKRQISTTGGYHLAWRRDGKELFYIDSAKKMMAVDVRGEGPTFEVGTPKALFDLRVPSFNSAQAQFAVTPDGQKFLVANTAGEITSAPINVVLNWTAGLKR